MTEEKQEFEFPIWAIVELLGRVVVAGEISEKTIVGKPLLRIDHPHTSKQHAFINYINPDAIYRITPTTEVIAREIAERLDPRPTVLFNLDHQLRHLLVNIRAPREELEPEYEKMLDPGESETEAESELEYEDAQEFYEEIAP